MQTTSMSYPKVPCDECPIRDICKFCDTFDRHQFNSDIFDVQVHCKIQDKHVKTPPKLGTRETTVTSVG